MLMALGLFVFERATLPFSEMQRRADWRHPSTERVGARPAAQFTGPGAEQISLTGACIPEVGGSYSAIERLREMADTGEAWPLVDGTGRVFGDYNLVGLDERSQHFVDNGMPRKIDFAIDLVRVG